MHASWRVSVCDLQFYFMAHATQMDKRILTLTDRPNIVNQQDNDISGLVKCMDLITDHYARKKN